MHVYIYGKTYQKFPYKENDALITYKSETNVTSYIAKLICKKE